MWPLASFVARSAWETLRRFPGPLLAGAVSGALLIQAQHENFRGEEPFRFILAASLGLPLGTALTLFAERPPAWLARVQARRALAFVLTLVLVSAYAAALNALQGHGDGYVLRFAQLSVAAHLAVAFAPFLSTPTDRVARTQGVWQLGRHLFLRLPLAALYALVVFAGLALALGAVVQLFDVDVDSDRYFELWIVCTFVLQTWIFLAGIPRDFAALEQDPRYPRGLRIFAQFVLLPLLGLYLVILYAYGVKILLGGSLPSGWVGWLVSAAGAFGMLSLLLLFPARHGPAGRFVRRVETGFHLAILPLLGLLFVSLFVRIDAYGFTERRYFLAVLGLWLALASVYRLKWGRRTLTWIPVSLCLVAAVTSFGPWGALSVARESQSARLTALLQKTGTLQGPAPGSVSLVDRSEMSRILDYLVETHGKATLARWPGPNGASEAPAAFLAGRGLDYVDRYGGGASTISFHAREQGLVEVKNYDFLLPLNVYQGAEPSPDSSRFDVRLTPSGTALEVLDRGQLRGTVSFSSALAELEKAPTSHKEAEDPLIVSAQSGGLRLQLFITVLHAERRSGEWAIQSATGDLLIAE